MISECWKSDLEIVTCSAARAKQVKLSLKAFAKVVSISLRIKTEWLAFLIGKESHLFFLVQDIYIPEQEVTAASVIVLEEFPLQGTIGTIHSHGSMKAFSSSVDESHANYPIRIITDDNLDFKAYCRVTTECGRISELETIVNIVAGKLELSKIKLKKPAMPFTYPALAGYPEYSLRMFPELNAELDDPIW